MANQQKTQEVASRNSITLPVTLGLAFFAQCEQPLNLLLAQIHHVLCGLAGQFFAVLPSLALTLFQNIFAADHQQLFTGAQVAMDTCDLLRMILRVV